MIRYHSALVMPDKIRGAGGVSRTSMNLTGNVYIVQVGIRCTKRHSFVPISVVVYEQLVETRHTKKISKV